MTYHLVSAFCPIRLCPAAGTSLLQFAAASLKIALRSTRPVLSLPLLPCSSVRRLRGALLRPLPIRAYRRSAPLARRACCLLPQKLFAKGFPPLTFAGLLNCQFHSGLRRNETSGFGVFISSVQWSVREMRWGSCKSRDDPESLPCRAAIQLIFLCVLSSK